MNEYQQNLNTDMSSSPLPALKPTTTPDSSHLTPSTAATESLPHITHPGANSTPRTPEQVEKTKEQVEETKEQVESAEFAMPRKLNCEL